MTAFGQPALLERTSQVLAALEVAFTRLDTKASGTLTTKEVEDGLRLMGAELTDEQMGALIDRMDFDRNGVIDRTEFLDTLTPLDPATAPLFTAAISPLYLKMDDHLDALEEEEVQQLTSMVKRVSRVAAKANELGVSLMIDAEQTYMQPAIDQVALSLMRTYNMERAVILNTYQCYLKDSFVRVRADINRSDFYGFVFGAKIVRGAYMVQERKRAGERGYPDPIQQDLESTHRNYDAVAAYILSHKASGLHPPPGGCTSDDAARGRRAKALLMVATHNENSVRATVGLMRSMGIEKDGGVCFGQLRGMCDHVSLSLGNHGFWVYKYVPYGPVREVMPYLLRRAEENSSMMAGAGKERGMIWKELRSRLTSAPPSVGNPAAAN
uniref:Proline dehydrogenase n=2 Tax=Hemiselmis andersenii TaxID=464988 RepID=A0A6T8K9X6_HEMAN|mmetsp:Transcript_24530/g.56715  ORF Transcript_24530/g.56715 Transcript_24530/m.56715 type:complete len:383 (+) Transcript_24530:34-1182(+)